MIKKASLYAVNYAVSLFKKDDVVNVNFPITDNCNSRCVMCDIWKEKASNEISPQEIQQFFDRPDMRGVMHIGISGGEPTLRKDLVECVEAIVSTCKSLKTLSITSHGFAYKKWDRLMPEIATACQQKGVQFRMNLSLDGVGTQHDEIRGIPGAYGRVMNTYEIAKKNNIDLQFQSTISNGNLFGVNRLLFLARKNDYDVIFRKAVEIERLYNTESVEKVSLTEGYESFFTDFILSSEVQGYTKNPARRLFYKDLANQLDYGSARKAPCVFQKKGVLLRADKLLQPCSITDKILDVKADGSLEGELSSPHNLSLRKELMGDDCQKCQHDQSGAWNPFQLAREMVPLQYKAKIDKSKKIPGLMKSYGRTFKKFEKHADVENYAVTRAHIVGAYGGEHVGDAGILGGVVKRMKDRFPSLAEVVVYSFRENRTRWHLRGVLIDGVVITVKPFPKDYTGLFSDKDLVIYAGGPLMDLPAMLARNVEFIFQGLSCGAPFIVEGCGLGPLNSAYCRKLVEWMLEAASLVTLRSDYGRSDCLIKQDPAFDYVEYDRARESREIDLGEALVINKVKEFAEGFRKVVVLNHRNVWSRYTTGSWAEGDSQKIIKGFAQMIESYKDVAFVFVPFNVDHLGDCDVWTGLEIEDELKNKSNYYLVENEFSVTAMCRLLAVAQGAVMSRFHANIFAMSCGLETIGINYSMGKAGKVRKLFEDRGMSDALCELSDLKGGNWIAQPAIAKLLRP